MPVHRSPRSHLPGDAAGGRPGWQDRLLTLVDDNEREKADRRGAGMRNWPARLTIVCDIEFRRLLRTACERRGGISASAYARRATAAFVAADLGLAFEDVCTLLPRASSMHGPMVPGQPAELRPLNNPGKWPDDGRGYGKWVVGCD